MMPDPNQLTQAVTKALTVGSTDARGEDARSRQAQLSFSAMLFALQSNCQCEGCQLLREAVDSMRVRPRSQEVSHGPSDNPQT